MKRMLDGLLFGIGLGTAALGTALVFAFLVPWDKAVSHQTAAMSDAAMDSVMGGGKVAILTHEKYIRGDDLVVVGALKNQGTQTARSFSIEVELYDKDNKFVDLCRESYYGSLKPGEERNFRVGCISCRNRPVAEHASYKIRVVDG